MPSVKMVIPDDMTLTETTEAWKTIKFIDKTQHAFIQTGRALIKFRDKKMWRVLGVDNFEEGCKKRWGWTVRRAQQYCKALTYWEEEKEAAKEAGLPAPKPPENEWQARALMKGKASEKPLSNTKGLTEEKANDRSPSQERNYSDAYTSSTGSAKSDSEVIKDNLGYIVPDHILPLWKRGMEIGEMMSEIRKLKVTLTRYENLTDPLFRGFSFSTVQNELGTAWDHLNCYLPEVVCYRCDEKLIPNCPFCGGRGFVTKHIWDRSATKPVKAARPQLTA